jgi:hypothetical protein
MVRNALTYVLLAGVIWSAAGSLALAQVKIRDDVSSQVSTVSLGQLVLRETFDDNKVASMWRVWADDVNNCWVSETNGRLEVRAKSAASNAFSGYVAYGWRLDPHDDFSMRVDFHLDLKKMEKTWVSLGVTPDAKNPRSQRINIDAQAGRGFKSFLHEYVDSTFDSSYIERDSDNGTLYVSYTAEDDTIYLSMVGYGPTNAFGTYQGVLQGTWAGKPLYVWVGGGSDGLEVTSGHVYVDNLEVETGTIVESSLQAVYHFQSAGGEKHFYTMSESEKEKLLKSPSKAWIYDGPAFYAFPDDTDPDSKPVYRFWSAKMGLHYYTISEAEKSQRVDSSDWTYEGVAFYAYPAGQQPAWALPVYRFWSSTYSSYLYTNSETEKKDLINKSATLWAYQGIVWYAVR